MSRPEIAPENCPEPYNHEVFRYCPVCTWALPEEPKPILVPLPTRDELAETVWTDGFGGIWPIPSDADHEGEAYLAYEIADAVLAALTPSDPS